MTGLVKRLVGITLIIAICLGLIVNLTGLFLIGRFEEGMQQGVVESLTVFDQTLSAAADGLTVVRSSLDDASESVGALEATTRSVAKTVKDTKPSLDTSARLMGSDLPMTIATTQNSLAAASQGAESIEQLLRTLSVIPFLDLPTYNPPVPLAESLASVQASLDPLSDSFIEFEENIQVSSDNLDDVNREIIRLANRIGEIQDTITEAKGVVGQFEQVVAQQQSVITTLQDNAEVALFWISRGLMVILIWVGVIQLALLVLGFEMAAGK